MSTGDEDEGPELYRGLRVTRELFCSTGESGLVAPDALERIGPTLCAYCGNQRNTDAAGNCSSCGARDFRRRQRRTPAPPFYARLKTPGGSGPCT